MILRTTIALFAALLLMRCSPSDEQKPLVRTLEKESPVKFETPQKLISFVNDHDNGYIKTKTLGEISYTSILKPMDYLMAEYMVSGEDTSMKKKDFDDLQYFDLRIKISDFNEEFIKYKLGSAAQYQERVQYCAFDMQRDIMLVDGKDTLPCLLYHFERAFNVVPYGHFILGFAPKKGNTVSTKTLIFNDRLFNNGLIQFTYLPETLVKEPTLL